LGQRRLAIVIDPDCEAMREEVRLYSWQTDRLTHQSDRCPQHGWDAVRYAVEDCITDAPLAADDPGFFFLSGPGRRRDLRENLNLWHEER
jgi:hypothetical protein